MLHTLAARASFTQQVIFFQEVNLLADIGGQLGLWIGISALTVCELLELLMKMFSHLIKKCDNLSNGQVTQVVPAYGYR